VKTTLIILIKSNNIGCTAILSQLAKLYCCRWCRLFERVLLQWRQFSVKVDSSSHHGDHWSL